MSDNIATELASTIQSTHIQHHPSVEHDVNPSTAASQKIPAQIVPQSETDDSSPDLDDSSSISSIPSDIIQPVPRSHTRSRSHLPLPDMRFEQTYLASIKDATNSQVAYITIRDQVLMPLLQGIGYHLLLSGWRYMNRGTKFRGQSLGAKVRKWWWGVNGWKLPRDEVKEFYVDKFGSSLGD